MSILSYTAGLVFTLAVAAFILASFPVDDRRVCVQMSEGRICEAR